MFVTQTIDYEETAPATDLLGWQESTVATGHGKLKFRNCIIALTKYLPLNLGLRDFWDMCIKNYI
jgi:hypothetical protein